MKHIQNLLEVPLAMLNNNVIIKAGGSAEITDREVESNDVMYAVRRGWAKIHDSKPEDIEVIKPEITFEPPAEEVGYDKPPTPEQVKAAANKVRGKTEKKADSE